MLKDQIAKLCPRPSSPTKAATWDQYINAICDNPHLFVEYGIDTQLEWCHLMAQWAHETGGFTVMYESGSYSADGLMRVFGVGVHSAKVTRDEAVALCSKYGTIDLDGKKVPAKDYAIFERVYGLGNPKKAAELGNRDDGDGYRYRGTGILQCTGRADHERLYAGDYSPENIIRVSLREWSEKNCGKYAMADDINKVTRLINGGYNGLPDRIKYYRAAKRIWRKCPDFGGPSAEDDILFDGADAEAPQVPTPPKTMAESKTGNTSLAIGSLTGLQSYSTMVKEGSAAVQTATEKGSSVIMALLANQDFMLSAATLIVGVGGAAFIWWDRRHKLLTHGI